MEQYVTIINYGFPLFFLLIIVESYIGKKRGIKINTGPDMISSFSSGIAFVVKEILGLTVVIIGYSWIVDKVAIIEIQTSWMLYLIGFIGLDLASYWWHRLKHSINIFWNRHIIHHSSEEFNLSCAFRLTISDFFSFFNVFLIPAAFFGVPVEVIAVITPIHLFGQFWYHTRIINKMGWLEHWLVTPSHHRVHHAMNPEYIDKNFGNIFIIWDKCFGTYQEELKDVVPVYGIKRPAGTWNPIIISFQHMWLLTKDAWHTNSYLDKIRIWLMPNGWRPPDVIKGFPVKNIEDVNNFIKYDSRPSRRLLNWVWFQLFITIALLFLLLNRFLEVGFPLVFQYGLYIYISIFSYSSLLDKVNYSIYTNIFRVLCGLLMIYNQGGWFGMENIHTSFTFLMVVYLIGSLILDSYFYFSEIHKHHLDSRINTELV